MDKLLTVEEGAGLLGTSVRFPRRLIAERPIRFVRVGRHVRVPEGRGSGVRGRGDGESDRDPLARRPCGRVMANRRGRRRFGFIRRLPSGRFQASYLGPDGQRRAAPSTFESKGDAARWLTTVESELLHGTWIDPERASIPLGEYGERWIAQRAGVPAGHRAHVGPSTSPSL